MTVNDVAAALALTPRTIRAQIAAGRLAARKAGRDWTITPAAVERYRATSLGKPGRRAVQR